MSRAWTPIVRKSPRDVAAKPTWRGTAPGRPGPGARGRSLYHYYPSWVCGCSRETATSPTRAGLGSCSGPAVSVRSSRSCRPGEPEQRLDARAGIDRHRSPGPTEGVVRPDQGSDTGGIAETHLGLGSGFDDGAVEGEPAHDRGAEAWVGEGPGTIVRRGGRRHRSAGPSTPLWSSAPWLVLLVVILGVLQLVLQGDDAPGCVQVHALIEQFPDAGGGA